MTGLRNPGKRRRLVLMEPTELKQILSERHGLDTTRKRAEVCGVGMRTMQRYEAGHIPVPRPVAHLVRLLRRVQRPEGVEARHLVA